MQSSGRKYKYLSCYTALFMTSCPAGSLVPHCLMFFFMTYFLINGLNSTGSMFLRSPSSHVQTGNGVSEFPAQGLPG